MLWRRTSQPSSAVSPPARSNISAVTIIIVCARISHGRRRPKPAHSPESTTGPHSHLKLQGRMAKAITFPTTFSPPP